MIQQFEQVSTLQKKTLNCYYNITDYSEVYRIAMGMFFCKLPCYFNSNLFYTVLHPHHKLMYFRKVGWSQDWIDTTHDIIQMENKCKYKSRIIERDEENEVEEIAPPISMHFCVNLIPCMSTDIELEQYLQYTPNAHYGYHKSRQA